MKDCIYEVFEAETLAASLQQRLESNAYHRFDDIKEDLYQAIARFRPRCYVLFAWSNEFWEAANTSCFRTRRREFAPGIVYSTVRQRIAESSRIEFSFRSGDYNRFFILIDLDSVTADIGRKSLPQDVANLASLIADSVHDRFVADSDALKPTPAARTEADDLELEQLLDRAIQEGTDLVESTPLRLHVLKEPREEQDVVALFFDLLGRDLLRGYHVYTSLISQKYDAVCSFTLRQSAEVLFDARTNPIGIPPEKFQKQGDFHLKRSPQRSFLEFKLNSDDLIRDFVRGDKRPKDIRWLVCWEIGTRHEKEGFNLTPILSEDNRNLREYYGVTHILSSPSEQVNVICLRDVLRELAR